MTCRTATYRPANCRLVALTALVALVSACGISGCSSQPVPEAPPSLADVAPPPVRQILSTDLAAGTVIPVDIINVLDSAEAVPNVFLLGRVPEDVLGTNGLLAIPAGSGALFIVPASAPLSTKEINYLTFSLVSVTIGGHSVTLADQIKPVATVSFEAPAAQSRSIHLSSGTRLEFKLQRAVALK